VVQYGAEVAVSFKFNKIIRLARSGETFLTLPFRAFKPPRRRTTPQAVDKAAPEALAQPIRVEVPYLVGANF
jgi:hypothetical protein